MTWYAFLLFFVPLFVAVWIGSMYLIAFAGGWRDLARVYRSDLPMELAHEWRNRGGQMRNTTRYNGCLNLGANSIGLRLSLWSLFRPGHPPLFIPWTDIQATPVRGMFFEMLEFSFARVPGVTLKVRRELGEEVWRTGHGAQGTA